MATERDGATNGAVTRDEVVRAIDHEEFFLVYQPTIDLQTNAFVGVEALLRWRHPTRGDLGPDAFLPSMEHDGAIVQVGSWVLGSACRQGADWHARGHRFTVSVNVSARQLHAPGFVQDVELRVDQSRFDAAHLVLEFSERALARTPGAVDLLKALKGVGVRLAVDDFGADAASEALVTTYPIDVVKIDRTCITGLASSPEEAARVHQLVQLGKSLHVQTVAQGIEDDDQRLQLLGEDVDFGQGFLFSVPHEVDVIDRFLEDYAIFSGKPL
jgi:EAL domain-containing protein (putative c-di-GMP-specific phosphodiesterase class I)